jgi:hypothetical protein
MKEDTIEERKETSRSSSLDGQEKPPTSSSSEDTPSVGDEGISAGVTEEDDLLGGTSTTDFHN